MEEANVCWENVVTREVISHAEPLPPLEMPQRGEVLRCIQSWIQNLSGGLLHVSPPSPPSHLYSPGSK